MKNPLIDHFKDKKQWVNWRFEKVKDRQTKIPYSIDGRKASSTDADTWATLSAAQFVSDKIGIIFTPEKLLLGIDIDHCIEDGKIVHEKRDEILAFLKAVDSYTELSPSKTGVHAFLILDAPLTLEANRKHCYELYTAGRFFTVTGEPFGKKVRPLRTVSITEALELLAMIGYPWKETVQKETVSREKSEKKGRNDSKQQKNTDIALSDEEVIARMLHGKNAAKMQALYDGDMSEYGNDASRADMALLCGFAFWTGKDTAQMERLWLASPIGQREKTQKRPDYRKRSIGKACKTVTDVYAPSPARSKDLDLLVTFTKDGEPKPVQNSENMRRILTRHPQFAGRFRFDSFRNIYEIREDPNGWRQYSDVDAIAIQCEISVMFPDFRKVGKEMVFDAMMYAATENSVDTGADYIKALTWDGTPRLNTWLTNAYGVPMDEYHIAIASNWLKGLVKRITEPGCQFDYVLVLEGAQGIGKSSSLNALGGDWHVESTVSTETKDFFMQFQGKAIIEFSEGETLSRTEVKRMKAIITMRTDRFRPPYGRFSMDFPRRCVFAMTTNQEEYLKDETGNRRWLPVRCEKADIHWIKENRDQLFAEAYARLQKGETTYEFPEELMRAAQESRRIEDANTEAIVDWYTTQLTFDQRSEGITTTQVYQGALLRNMPSGRSMAKYEQMAIADVLRSTLKLEKKRETRNGVRLWRWYDPALPVPIPFDSTEVAEEI